MRWIFALTFLVITTAARGADEPSGVTGSFDGTRVQFAADANEKVATAALALLGSCSYSSDGTKEDLAKAQKGDHLRFVFAKPRTVSVMNNMVEMTEIVIAFPLNTGVLWVRSGDKVLRYTKYNYKKRAQLEAWVKEAKPVP